MAALPRPGSGLVIGYSYFWEAEYRAGPEEGTKDRRCAVAIATRTEDGDIVVTGAPIIHSAPAGTQGGLERPAGVKRILGLDAECSACRGAAQELSRYRTRARNF